MVHSLHQGWDQAPGCVLTLQAPTDLPAPWSTPNGAEDGFGCRDSAQPPEQSAPGPSACPRSWGLSCSRSAGGIKRSVDPKRDHGLCLWGGITPPK